MIIHFQVIKKSPQTSIKIQLHCLSLHHHRQTSLLCTATVKPKESEYHYIFWEVEKQSKNWKINILFLSLLLLFLPSLSHFSPLEEYCTSILPIRLKVTPCTLSHPAGVTHSVYNGVMNCPCVSEWQRRSCQWMWDLWSTVSGPGHCNTLYIFIFLTLYVCVTFLTLRGCLYYGLLWTDWITSQLLMIQKQEEGRMVKEWEGVGGERLSVTVEVFKGRCW